MQDPIDHLLDEHRDILLVFDELRGVVRDLDDRGDEALADALPVLQAVGEMMAGRLHRHARKEDEALFPPLEAAFGGAGGPTAVMRLEHEAIREQAELYRRTLHELHAVEHPAIVAHGATLRELAGDAAGVSGDELRAIAAEIIRLVDLHFGKEEQVLFPMARQLLDAATLAGVMRDMEAIEAEAQA